MKTRPWIFMHPSRCPFNTSGHSSFLFLVIPLHFFSFVRLWPLPPLHLRRVSAVFSRLVLSSHTYPCDPHFPPCSSFLATFNLYSVLFSIILGLHQWIKFVIKLFFLCTLFHNWTLTSSTFYKFFRLIVKGSMIKFLEISSRSRPFGLM